VKILRTALFSLGCLLTFLLAAAASCSLRARYHYVPKLKSMYAYEDAGNLDRYSFLQYNQAGPEEGRAGLQQYLRLLQRIQDEHINFPSVSLHRDLGLTFLRLYRLESAAGNDATADGYMKSAQREFSSLGWKEENVSTEALKKDIETRELNEAKLYNPEMQVPARAEKQGQSQEKPK
jgi:hypothetical protein